MIPRESNFVSGRVRFGLPPCVQLSLASFVRVHQLRVRCLRRRRAKRAEVIGEHYFHEVARPQSKPCVFVEQIPQPRTPNRFLLDHVFALYIVSVLAPARHYRFSLGKPCFKDFDHVIAHSFSCKFFYHMTRVDTFESACRVRAI